MGAGKTSIGRRLAERLNKEFIDSDHFLEERTVVDVPTIFDIEGEEGFRNREAGVIDELTQRTDVVLATGGGSVLREENRSHLGSRGTVIYLCCSVEQQLKRTQNSHIKRPLLQTPDPKSKLESLFSERDPLYRSLSDITIETDGRSIKSVVSEILQRLNEQAIN